MFHFYWKSNARFLNYTYNKRDKIDDKSINRRNHRVIGCSTIDETTVSESKISLEPVRQGNLV